MSTLGCQSTELRTVVQPPAQIKAVLVVGQGPAGPAGGTANEYTHSQPTPSAVWVINHNLGRRVTVTPKTTGGAEFEAEVLEISLNQVQLLLAYPLAGTARCI